MNAPKNVGSLSCNSRNTPPKVAPKGNMVVNGQTFQLDPNTVRSYLVSGNGNVTDQEVAMFIAVCKDQGLNPFAKDAYLIKYGNSPAAVVTSIGAMEKRASDFEEYAGMESGIVVQTQDGGLEYRNGALYIPNVERIIGGWATVHRKDREYPIHYECTFDEYVQRKGNGEINSNWAGKPGVMIRKCAKAGALREAFPKRYASVYERDEIRSSTAQDFDMEEPAGIPEAEVITIDSPSEFEQEVQRTATDEILAGARK